MGRYVPMMKLLYLYRFVPIQSNLAPGSPAPRTQPAFPTLREASKRVPSILHCIMGGRPQAASLVQGLRPRNAPLQNHPAPTVFTLPQHRVCRTESTPPLLSHHPNPCSSPAVPLQFPPQFPRSSATTRHYNKANCSKRACPAPRRTEIPLPPATAAPFAAVHNRHEASLR